MRITLAAVGRLRRGPMQALFDEYARRLTWALSVREVVERGRENPHEIRAREGEALRAAIPGRATVVALDAGGAALDSVAFAQRLGGWREEGRSEVAFVIGGAEGLDPALLADAELRLSFGAMTWPHLLARVMLAEQLYRAQTILGGHPYHR